MKFCNMQLCMQNHEGRFQEPCQQNVKYCLGIIFHKKPTGHNPQVITGPFQITQHVASHKNGL